MPRKSSAVRSRATESGAKPQATRDVILDAAERRFAESGFASVSMRELAAEAGLRNQASLYSHFRDKRALYEAVLTRGMEPIFALVTASADEHDRSEAEVADDGLAFLDRVLDYLAHHPHLPRLIQRATLDDSRYLRKALPRLFEPLYQQGIRALAAAGGCWQPAQLPHVGLGLYQLIFGYFTGAGLFGSVVGNDPLNPAALERQRAFVKTTVALLLGRGANDVPSSGQRGNAGGSGVPVTAHRRTRGKRRAVHA